MKTQEIDMAKLGDISMRLNLYRNTTKGKIAGVCAGLADRYGIKRNWVRIGFVALAVVTHGFAIVLYLLLAIIIQPRDEPLPYAPAMAPAYQWTPATPPPPGPPPAMRVMDIRTRFTAIDARLSRIEAVITSNELSLRRKFRDLGG